MKKFYKGIGVALAVTMATLHQVRNLPMRQKPRRMVPEQQELQQKLQKMVLEHRSFRGESGKIKK